MLTVKDFTLFKQKLYKLYITKGLPCIQVLHGETKGPAAINLSCNS